MKIRIILAAVFLSISSVGFSQSYIDLGAKAYFGPALLKSNVSFGDDNYSHNFGSMGYGFGFKVAFDFNEKFALLTEINSFKYGQKFKMTANPGLINEFQYSKNIDMTSLEIPLMFRYTNDEKGKYVEIGYVMNSIGNVKEENTGHPTVITNSVDVSNQYKSNGGLVFGFGGYAYTYGNFGISTGLRLRYDLSDMTNNIDKVNTPSTFYALDNNVGAIGRVSVMFNVEFNFDLGWIRNNNHCTSRKKSMFGD